MRKKCRWMQIVVFNPRPAAGFFVCKEDDGYRESAKGEQVDTKRLTLILVKFLDLGYDKAYYTHSSIILLYY